MTYEPTMDDFQLLFGTEEWPEIVEKEGITDQ